MTDLAERAVARLTEIDDAIHALEHERFEISTALRVLATFLESNSSTAARKDVPFEAMHDASPDSAAAGGKTSAEAAAKLGAGTQAPPVETIQEPVAVDPTDPPRSGASEGNEDDLPAPDAMPSGRPSNRARVTALFAEHPEYTRKQAREALGLSEGSLDGTSHVLGIKWAPEPKPEPPRAELPRPVPKGKMFWLKNADGEYLNRFCDRMTRNRKEAWTGTEAQILGCRKNFSIARDLIERPVEKDGAFV